MNLHNKCMCVGVMPYVLSVIYYCLVAQSSHKTTVLEKRRKNNVPTHLIYRLDESLDLHFTWSSINHLPPDLHSINAKWLLSAAKTCFLCRHLRLPKQCL